ncbi:MAG: GNAT family N-acetyltransferase [Verrucomicrobiales bacterium]
MTPSIRAATSDDSAVIADVLIEAAEWLIATGRSLWSPEEFTKERISPEASRFFLVAHQSKVAAVYKLEDSDPIFWPDVRAGESLFLHKLAVRRAFAGQGLPMLMLDHAVEQARVRKKKYLRLDCDAPRSRLRELYEGFGFSHHSDWTAGEFHVARYQYEI